MAGACACVCVCVFGGPAARGDSARDLIRHICVKGYKWCRMEDIPDLEPAAAAAAAPEEDPAEEVRRRRRRRCPSSRPPSHACTHTRTA